MFGARVYLYMMCTSVLCLSVPELENDDSKKRKTSHVRPNDKIVS